MNTLERAAMTDVGRVREVNEDRALAVELRAGSVLLAVADGVGGMPGGAVASEAAIRTLREDLVATSVDDPSAALARAFGRVNERVRSLVGSGDEPVATTLVAAFVRDGQAWLANVGDSRAYVFSDGRFEQITRDHSLVAEQVSAGVLTAEQAETSVYANVITRGIGVADEVRADGFGPIGLAPGSVLLLCSDGLYRVVEDASIVEALSSPSIADAASRLIESANRAGGPDNIALALCRRSAPMKDNLEPG